MHQVVSVLVSMKSYTSFFTWKPVHSLSSATVSPHPRFTQERVLVILQVATLH